MLNVMEKRVGGQLSPVDHLPNVANYTLLAHEYTQPDTAPS